MSEDRKLGRPSDDDALKLSVAFYCITEPAKRAELIGLAERLASESEVVDGITHFLLLDKDLR